MTAVEGLCNYASRCSVEHLESLSVDHTGTMAMPTLEMIPGRPSLTREAAAN